MPRCSSDDSKPIFPDAPRNPDKARLLQLVNEARAQSRTCELDLLVSAPPLAWSETLAAVAQLHCEDMEAAGRLSHRGTNGSFLDERLEQEGYTALVWAENLAIGVETEMEVVEEWLNSPGHCENIMLPDVLEMGVATSGPYWTMILAARD